MKLHIAALLSATLTLAAVVTMFDPKHYAWIGDQTGYSPVQPIAYSHKVHAKDNGIPCEYCHFSARKGPVAGVPPANVCMNCHSQILKDSPEIAKIRKAISTKKPIEWVRINRVADFVRFNHSAHVAKGVACQTCHGQIQDMTQVEQTRHMSMGWCVSCHRQYTAKPPKGMGKVNARVECSTCHY
ncbi:MAG: cytochrome c3 family protein [Chthonomonadales bacterium]|nr:cytochrome c3 family protein [Chthonomonadales bacterium]